MFWWGLLAWHQMQSFWIAFLGCFFAVAIGIPELKPSLSNVHDPSTEFLQAQRLRNAFGRTAWQMLMLNPFHKGGQVCFADRQKQLQNSEGIASAVFSIKNKRSTGVSFQEERGQIHRYLIYTCVGIEGSLLWKKINYNFFIGKLKNTCRGCHCRRFHGCARLLPTSLQRPAKSPAQSHPTNLCPWGSPCPVFQRALIEAYKWIWVCFGFLLLQEGTEKIFFVLIYSLSHNFFLLNCPGPLFLYLHLLSKSTG